LIKVSHTNGSARVIFGLQLFFNWSCDFSKHSKQPELQPLSQEKPPTDTQAVRGKCGILYKDLNAPKYLGKIFLYE
tara:strand:+ start:308 stop:535 length:228 start_codon:yes stop_codon:yes gene_type:complete